MSVKRKNLELVLDSKQLENQISELNDIMQESKQEKNEKRAEHLEGIISLLDYLAQKFKH